MYIYIYIAIYLFMLGAGGARADVPDLSYHIIVLYQITVCIYI